MKCSYLSSRSHTGLSVWIADSLDKYANVCILDVHDNWTFPNRVELSCPVSTRDCVQLSNHNLSGDFNE